MADEGWIKLYRKIKKSFVWSNPYQLKLWILILTKASHQPTKFIFNGQEMSLNSGQLVTGRAALTSEMNEGVKPAQLVNSAFVWRTLKKFESAEMLHIESTTRYSVITVLNWDGYQQSEQLPHNNRTATAQPTDTYKNEKNDKNISTTTTDNVFDFYQQNGFGPISGFTAQDLDMWRDDFIKIGADQPTAEQILIMSMQVAIDRNKRSWGYAKAILKSWYNANLNTIEGIEAEQASFNVKNKQFGKKLQGKQQYQEHEYTQEDGEWS